MSDDNTQEIEAPAEVEDAAPVAPGLSIQDLTLMVNVLEATSQRGAIRANEMALVGNLYNNLVNFLVANGVIQPASAQSNEVEHTHEDGTTHAHEDGDVEHSHDEGEADNA